MSLQDIQKLEREILERLKTAEQKKIIKTIKGEDFSNVTYNMIIHQAREEFKLNVLEYAIVDTIDKLSRSDKGILAGRWCFSKHENLGKCMGVSKKTIDRMLPGLLKKKLLEKDERTKWLRTTDRWTERVNFYKGKLHKKN